MCCRYILPDEGAVERLCATDFRRGFSWIQPLFNVAPTAQVPIIVKAPDGALEIKGARWGLIPSWWQKDASPALTFNARSEDAAEKPVWRDSFKTTRCLMPARGWYEWNKNQPLPGKAGRQGGQPYFIFCPHADVIAFAGLWSRWVRPSSEPVVSCALLTTWAAPSIAALHPRMPVVLKPEQHGPWLDPATSAEGVHMLLAGAREDLAGYPVSTRVNNIRNDCPELLARVPVQATGGLDFGGPEPQ